MKDSETLSADAKRWLRAVDEPPISDKFPQWPRRPGLKLNHSDCVSVARGLWSRTARDIRSNCVLYLIGPSAMNTLC